MLNQKKLLCEECPYIIREYRKRKAFLESRNFGIPPLDILKTCYCKKISGKLNWQEGPCSDSEVIEEIKPVAFFISDKEKHQRRREIAAKRKIKLKNKAQIPHWHRPAYGITEDGKIAFDEDKVVYYTKYYSKKHSDSKKKEKRANNKRVRRYFNCIDDYEYFYDEEYGWDMFPIVNEDYKYGLANKGNNYKKI